MKKIALSFLVVLISCQQPAPLTDQDKARVISEVRTTLNRYCDDVRNSGLIAEFQYLDSTKEFSWTPPGFTAAISFDSVAAILRANASNLKKIDNRFDTLRIVALTQEYATYSGRLTSKVTDMTDSTVTLSLVETGVLVKRKDGWKLLSGQTAITPK